MAIQFVSDIVEDNGLTVRENNMNKTHRIPLGSIVEVLPHQYAEEYPTEGLRLFVVMHMRDCDGTPLYGLSHKKTAAEELAESGQAYEKAKRTNDPYVNMALATHWLCKGRITGGYGEESIAVIKSADVKG